MKNDEFKKSLQFPTNIKEQQESIKNSIFNLNDQYIQSNSYEVKEYLSYLMSAIYLTYKKLYPDLSIYIPFRIKSDDSAMKNYKKEISNTTKKYTLEDNLFDVETPISSDFLAGTIVLDHIKNSIKTKTNYSTDKILELQALKQDTLNFINEVEEKINSDFIDEEEYMTLKQDIIKRIMDCTYPEFTNERTVSYATELNEIDRSFKIKQDSNTFLSSISPEQINNLKDLLLDLRSRSSDKLQYEILRETIPTVFSSPLIKNTLKTNFKFVKDSRKPNGFAALYYLIETPFGPIEIQAQSNKRYYEAKKGSAFHSGILGKEFDISSFFELVDPNDKRDLKFYLSKLDSIRADEILSDSEIPDFSSEEEKYKFLNSPEGKNYELSKKVKEYMSHIKIKDNYEYTPKTTIKVLKYDSVSDTYYLEEQEPKPGTQVQSKTIVNTDTYLLSVAKSISPFMNVCSSGHTSFSTASIHQKNLVGEFTEVLRKKDATTCLRNMLISRLRTILKTTTDKDYLESQQIRNSLPKDIAKEDITQYANDKLFPRLKELEDAGR